MVEYESKGNVLTCAFPDGVPSAGEIIHSVLDAPIEYGADFANKKKGKKQKKALCLKDDFLEVLIDGLKDGAINTVISSEEIQEAGFKYLERNDKVIRFQVPQRAISDQARIMR